MQYGTEQEMHYPLLLSSHCCAVLTKTASNRIAKQIKRCAETMGVMRPLLCSGILAGRGWVVRLQHRKSGANYNSSYSDEKSHCILRIPNFPQQARRSHFIGCEKKNGPTPLPPRSPFLDAVSLLPPVRSELRAVPVIKAVPAWRFSITIPLRPPFPHDQLLRTVRTVAICFSESNRTIIPNSRLSCHASR
jgi:hypothetical protein